MPKMLIVDDELKIRQLIRKYAEFEGYEVEEACDGMDAVLKTRAEKFDIIIMDIMMPELDGLSASREIRRTGDTPIILLSARGEDYDKISGFELGADDYVVKPVSPKELMLRAAAILKRVSSSSSGRTQSGDVYESDGLVVDFTARLVTADGVRVEMSPKEYDLFFYLVRNRGIALSREKLITEVWGYDFYGDDRTLDTHIKLLRRSLGRFSDRIVTLRGVGYRFENAAG